MILNVTSYPRSGNSFFTTTLLQFGEDWWYQAPATRFRLPVHFKPVGRVYDSGALGWYGVEHTPWCQGAIDHVEDPQPDKYINDTASVYLYKRHDYPDGYSGPRIVVFRDGRDVLCSFAHHNVVHRAIAADPENQEIFAQQPPPMRLVNAEAERILEDPNAQWGPLVEYAIDHPNTVARVRYEEMKRDASGTVQAALAAAGYYVQQCKEPLSWEKLHGHAPHFFRRGTPGGWRDLCPVIVEEFVRRNRDTLQRLRYI